MKRSVLFVCTLNSVRSQMGEALLRHHGGDRYKVYSAGISPGAFVDPGVRAVLEEAGVSTGELTPKTIGTVRDVHYDIVAVVCSDSCTLPLGSLQADTIIYREFSVPGVSGSDGLDGFRRLRDEMLVWIREEFL